jgi:hypothetical protein
MKYFKYIIIIATLLLTNTVNAQTFSNNATPYNAGYNGDRPPIVQPSSSVYLNSIDTGDVLSSITYPGYKWEDYRGMANSTYLATDTAYVAPYLASSSDGSAKLDCNSQSNTLNGFGFEQFSWPDYTGTTTGTTFTFTGPDCGSFLPNTAYNLGWYDSVTNDFLSDDYGWSLSLSGNTTVGGPDYTLVLNAGPAPVVQEEIWLEYPTNGSSVQSPVQIIGKYNNNGSYDQLGVDVYYNNELDELVSAFTWYSIPQEEGTNIPFSYSIVTVPDEVYQIKLSLNENGGTEFYESEFYDFDTYDLIAPDVYEDATLPCSSNLDFYCYGKKLLSWAFLPSQNTLNNFSQITLKDKAPISYAYEINSLFDTLTSQENVQSFEMVVNTPIGDITFIDQEMIDNIPFVPFMRIILTAMIYFLGSWTLYAIARKAF